MSELGGHLGGGSPAFAPGTGRTWRVGGWGAPKASDSRERFVPPIDSTLTAWRHFGDTPTSQLEEKLSSSPPTY